MNRDREAVCVCVRTYTSACVCGVCVCVCVFDVRRANVPWLNTSDWHEWEYVRGEVDIIFSRQSVIVNGPQWLVTISHSAVLSVDVAPA